MKKNKKNKTNGDKKNKTIVRRKKTKVKALVENVDVAVEREEQNKKTEVLQVIAEKKLRSMKLNEENHVHIMV